MNPAETTKAIAESGLAPSVQMVLLIVFLLLLLSAPAALFIRDWRNKGKVDERDDKEGNIKTGFYVFLNEQVSVLTNRLDAIHGEYNAMVKENAELRARVVALENCEEMVLRLQKKLDEKDNIIMARDAQLNVLFSDLRMRDQKIIELQDRLNVLEVHVATTDARTAKREANETNGELPPLDLAND